MTLTQNALVLRTTHQPAKPVETINTSHVFAAETIKTKLLNKNSPLNVEAAKNKANVKTKFILFWSSKKQPVRHETCQKLYTAAFSGQKFYTLYFTEFQQLW